MGSFCTIGGGGRVADSVTGTTTDNHVNALDWVCWGFSNKNIMLKNTHASSALKYKVLTYAYPGGVEYEEVAETSLLAGDRAKIVLNYAYAEIKVLVKSSIAGSAATYQCDYVGVR